VSLRKQEIADRLNAWIIFNEKNRELCEWLTQMENKVAHSAGVRLRARNAENRIDTAIDSENC